MCGEEVLELRDKAGGVSATPALSLLRAADNPLPLEVRPAQNLLSREPYGLVRLDAVLLGRVAAHLDENAREDVEAFREQVVGILAPESGG